MDRYYKILKLEPDASFEEVKKAYRGQVKFWHPDRFPAESPRLQKKAHEMLQSINEAFKKLESLHKARPSAKTAEKQKTSDHPSHSKSDTRKASEPGRKSQEKRTETKAPPPQERKATPPPRQKATPPKAGDGVHTLPNGDQYIGDVRDNRFHGQGTYIFKRGDKYVGEFRENKPHGMGTFYYSNGDKYVGEFRSEEMSGHGTYFHGNGDRYTGEFKNGEPHGRGTYRCANGREYHGLWENGVLT